MYEIVSVIRAERGTWSMEGAGYYLVVAWAQVARTIDTRDGDGNWSKETKTKLVGLIMDEMGQELDPRLLWGRQSTYTTQVPQGALISR